jgi:hypothetical protein
MGYGKYVLYIIVLIAVGILYEKYKQHNDSEDDDRQYDLVRKYLLNDVSLARSHLPIIWIHASKEVNARWWPAFNSRNTKCVNQPYEFITIKSIIDKCGKSFNVCLIDDATFGKLMPDWHIDLDRVAEPVKSKIRELAFARLLHAYGGFRVPASFLCMKDLKKIYEEAGTGDGVLVGELLNRGVSSEEYVFMTSPEFLACEKGNHTIDMYIEYLQRMISEDYTAQSVFTGAVSEWFASQKNSDITAVAASMLGVIDTEGKAVTVERLAGNSYVPLCPEACGIYFPAHEILHRTAFQWLARLSPAQVLDSDTMMGKALLVGSQQPRGL